MTREEKANIIGELVIKFGENDHFYITDASGLTVEQVNEFRRLCFKNGIEYGVYKNTLIRKALETQKDTDYTRLFEVLNGFSGILFSREVANAPAKVMKEIRVKLKGRPLLKGACVAADIYVGDEALESLSQLKSRNELIGDVMALLQSPARNVISALQHSKNQVAGLLKALEQRSK